LLELELDGRSMARVPIEERKAHLARVIRNTTSVVCIWSYDDPEALFEEADQLGMEGLVVKARARCTIPANVAAHTMLCEDQDTPRAPRRAPLGVVVGKVWPINRRFPAFMDRRRFRQ